MKQSLKPTNLGILEDTIINEGMLEDFVLPIPLMSMKWRNAWKLLYDQIMGKIYQSIAVSILLYRSNAKQLRNSYKKLVW